MLNGSSKAVEEASSLVVNGNGHATKTPDKDPAAVLADMQRQIKELQEKLSLARGTEEITPPVRMELTEKIEHTLRSKICTTAELAKTINEPLIKVQEKLKAIRRHLADVGTPEEARWVWRIGDDTPASELRRMVAMLIEGRTLTTAELTRITGARMSRVNGVIVELQRDPEVPIYNLGSQFRAKWLILPKEAKPAKLPPKANKGKK